jgi:hypothetical protein
MYATTNITKREEIFEAINNKRVGERTFPTYQINTT